MKTKTEKAIKLYKEGKIKEAMRIFKSFKLNIPKEDKRKIEIAYECLAGKSCFYTQLGIDTKEIINQAKAIIQKTWITQ